MELDLIFAISCGKIQDIELNTLDQKAEIMTLATRGLYSQR